MTAASQCSPRPGCIDNHRSPPRWPTSDARASSSRSRSCSTSPDRAGRTTGSTMSCSVSAEDRAVVVLDGTSGRVRAHQQEAARAERLVGPLGLQPVQRLAAVVDGTLLVIVVVLVLGSDHPILEDPV